jgi:hypothetical protein
MDLGLSLVILNRAERSEESLRYPVTSQGSRDFSLPAVAQNDIQAKVLAACRRESSEVSHTGFTGKVTLIMELICL